MLLVVILFQISNNVFDWKGSHVVGRIDCHGAEKNVIYFENRQHFYDRLARKSSLRDNKTSAGNFLGIVAVRS